MKKVSYLLFITFLSLSFTSCVKASSNFISKKIYNMNYQIIINNKIIKIPCKRIINNITNNNVYSLDINLNLSDNYNMIKSSDFKISNRFLKIYFDINNIIYRSNKIQNRDENLKYIFTQKYVWELLGYKVNIVDNNNNFVFESFYQVIFDTYIKNYGYGISTYDIKCDDCSGIKFIKKKLDIDVLEDSRLYVENNNVYAKDPVGYLTSYYISNGEKYNSNYFESEGYSTLIDVFSLPYKRFMYSYNKPINNANIKFIIQRDYKTSLLYNNQLQYGLYNEYDELIDILRPSTSSFFTRKMYYGKYYIKQLNNSNLYAKDNQIYEFEISDKVEKLDILIKQSIKNVNIHLEYCDNSCHDLKDTQVLISAKNYQSKLKSDDKGNISTILSVGNYTISQIDKLDKYYKPNDINLLIEEHSSDNINVNLSNYIKKGNISVYFKNIKGDNIDDIKLCLYKLNDEVLLCDYSSDGKITFNNVSFDNYYIKQEQVPKLYDLNNNIEYINMNSDKAIYYINYEKEEEKEKNLEISEEKNIFDDQINNDEKKQSVANDFENENYEDKGELVKMKEQRQEKDKSKEISILKSLEFVNDVNDIEINKDQSNLNKNLIKKEEKEIGRLIKHSNYKVTSPRKNTVTKELLNSKDNITYKNELEESNINNSEFKKIKFNFLGNLMILLLILIIIIKSKQKCKIRQKCK